MKFCCGLPGEMPVCFFTCLSEALPVCFFQNDAYFEVDRACLLLFRNGNTREANGQFFLNRNKTGSAPNRSQLCRKLHRAAPCSDSVLPRPRTGAAQVAIFPPPPSATSPLLPLLLPRRLRGHDRAVALSTPRHHFSPVALPLYICCNASVAQTATIAPPQLVETKSRVSYCAAWARHRRTSILAASLRIRSPSVDVSRLDTIRIARTMLLG